MAAPAPASNSADPALAELFDLIERRFALRLLWALREPVPQSFRSLQESLGGVSPGTLNTRLKELRDAGLLAHNGEGYGLTTAGLELIRRLGEWPAFARRLATARAKRKGSGRKAAPAGG